MDLKKIRYAGMYKELDYFIGFSMAHNDKKTVDEFNAALFQLHKDGVIRELLARYQMNPSNIE